MPKAPVRIGFVGAPGAGKSKIARGLKKNASDILGHEPIIVDNYAQKLQRDTGQALGQFGTYSENYMVAGARHAAEFKAINEGVSVFTVGTMLETFLYAVMTSDAEMQSWNAQEAMRIAQGAMAGFGVFFSETFTYDAVIYLPSKKGDGWSKVFDDHLPGLAVNFSIPFSRIEGTDSERIQKATTVLEWAHEKSPEFEVPVNETVDDSGEDSE